MGNKENETLGKKNYVPAICSLNQIQRKIVAFACKTIPYRNKHSEIFYEHT